jgi:hypothetical protein
MPAYLPDTRAVRTLATSSCLPQGAVRQDAAGGSQVQRENPVLLHLKTRTRTQDSDVPVRRNGQQPLRHQRHHRRRLHLLGTK